MADISHKPSRAGTGIKGLDDVLNGGLVRERLYLLEGHPGTGKTTIAMQLLLNGALHGERGLYITLSETEQELRETMHSHGWSLPEGVEIFELLPPESLLDEDQQQSLLYSADLELGETAKRIIQSVERTQPQLVVLDSLSEIRLLAQSSLRYRRQILALKHYFSKKRTTTLMLDDLTADTNDKAVHSVAHGVLRLEELAPLYGSERRRLRVTKYRASDFRGGYHDFSIAMGGVSVFPRLRSAEYRSHFDRGQMSSGIPYLDQLLGGGIERGSGTLILGPAGAGKSLIALNFAIAAIARGEKAAVFIFDEELGLLLDRTRALGIDLEKLQASGRLFIEQVDAAELSPGEFSESVRKRVDEHQVKTVVIDSLNGYQAAMPEEQFLLLHIHELLQYLNRQGVATFLTVAQHGLVGDMKAPVDVTYLADTVILLRFFEALGRVRRAISVIKKRMGKHENTIREFQIDAHGISLGEALENFHGVLRGVPTFTGDNGGLMQEKNR